jgi:nucleoside-diphosphate-sugar epimerase
MAGFKFGTIADPSMTWGMNCYLPSLVSRKYRNSRIAAFSTGNIYGMVANLNDGSVESDVPRPVGEYAMAALGRERVFQYFSRALRVPMVLLRLNYATELRYGVLVDLAQKIWTGQPIDLSMGYVNVIWQTDANAMALTALEHAASPPFVVNIAGEPILSIRQVAAALVSNGRRGHRLLGKPKTDSAAMIRWTADWIRGGGRILDKPTHFEDRAGNF